MKVLMSVFVLFFSAKSFADYEFLKNDGKIEFFAKGWPSLLKINGLGEGAYGHLKETDGYLSGKINFDLKTLKTGIDLRDQHMKEKYLEVEKFPKASLKISSFKLPKKLSGKAKFEGVLDLHGVSKKITGVAKIKTLNGNVALRANFKIKISDYKIKLPSFKGITVAEDVKVEISSDVKRVNSLPKAKTIKSL